MKLKPPDGCASQNLGKAGESFSDELYVCFLCEVADCARNAASIDSRVAERMFKSIDAVVVLNCYMILLRHGTMLERRPLQY